MSPISSIRNLMSKFRAEGVKPSSEEPQGLQRPVTPEMEFIDRQSLRSDRRSVILDCQKMAKTDPRVKRLLYKLSADAFVGKFSVKVESAETETVQQQAQERIDDFMRRCQVRSKIRGWARACLRDGDLFLQVMTDDKAKKVARLKKLATIITFSSMSSTGDFPEDKPAYYQEHPWSQEELITFEKWQVVHIPWEAEDGQPYGTPLLAAARLSWGRLDNGEKNLVIRRSVGAGIHRQHKVGTEKNSNWQLVEEYKKKNRDTLANPLAPSQNFYTTADVEISDLKQDTQLGDITDIQYFEGHLSMVTGVPIALLSGGREESINRDVLEEQEEDYLRVVADINTTMEHGLREVLEFDLMLSGINPESVTYTFNWGAKDRDDLDAKIDRAKKLQEVGFSFETILDICDLEGIDLETELERIRAQIVEGAVPYGISMKVQTELLMLLQAMAGQTQSPPIVEQVGELKSIIEEYLLARDQAPGVMLRKVK